MCYRAVLTQSQLLYGYDDFSGFSRAAERLVRLGVLLPELKSLWGLHGWSVRQFRSLWYSLDCRVQHFLEDRDMHYLDMIEEFPGAFCGRELTLEEVTLNSIEIVLRAPGSERTFSVDSGL